MRFADRNSPLRSKLAWRPTPNFAQEGVNAAMPALMSNINENALLIELYFNFNSWSINQSLSHMALWDENVTGHYVDIRLDPTTRTISPLLFGTGWFVDNYPLDLIGLNYYAFLWDFASKTFRYYHNGALIDNGTWAFDIDMRNAATYRFGARSDCCTDTEIILNRISCTSSVPADIDDIIQHMYQFPMEIHTDLQGLAIILGSQYDFENQIVDDGGHAYRTIEDHGVIGGYNLGTFADLEDVIVIAEKADMAKPDKIYYKFDGPHYAANWGFGGHGIQAGAHIVEALLPLYEYYNCPTSQNPFYIRDATNTHWIVFRTIGDPNRYEVRVEDGSGARNYQIWKNLFDFDVMHIVVDGGTTYVLLDGQVVVEDASGKTPDYSGVNIKVQMAGTIPGHTTAMRFWNYPAGTLPSGWENEIARRVVNPWPRSEVLGDANLRLEYLMNSDIPDVSTVIPNSANPGVGDLTISGGATFADSRQEWRLP